MHDLYARTLVVLKAAPTWLVAASMVLTIFAEEITTVAGADHPIVTLVARVLVWIGAAIAIIRRVTPVLPEARGILPPPDGEPATLAEREYLTAYLKNIQ